eukprot:6018924-Pleurochrysis_carterae.AAC.1
MSGVANKAVPSASNAGANMHLGPLPQKHPSLFPLPVEMSRYLAAHEVVNVSVALVHVVVVDPPTVSRRTSYPISHVMHAPFEDVSHAVRRHSPLLIDCHMRHNTYHPTLPFLFYLYLSQRSPHIPRAVDPSNPPPLELGCALDAALTHTTPWRVPRLVSHCLHSVAVAVPYHQLPMHAPSPRRRGCDVWTTTVLRQGEAQAEIYCV